MNTQFFRFTLLLLICFSLPSIATAQVEISAVPNANNPVVDDQIEVSINIAGGAGIAGYEFTLTFDSTHLQYISIENADYLPAGAFPTTPIVESGSVRFAAAGVSGTGDGDGTLAVATFKVLATTETMIELEKIVIGDRTAQPLGIASVIGATINRAALAADTEVEYHLSIPAGLNLIHVPLKVNAVDGVAQTITSVGDLYNALGGGSSVRHLITYNAQTQEWRSYFGDSDRGASADAPLTDDTGIIAGLIAPVSVLLRGMPLGTNGNGTITLTPGLNLVGLPLSDPSVMRVSDLFTLNGIGDNVPVIILSDGGTFKTVGRAGDPGDIEITGGQAFILTAQRPATVVTSGAGWANTK